jgi:hypothetical protein
VARSRWEHKVIDRVGDWVKLANEMGAEGWELTDKHEMRWMPDDLKPLPDDLARQGFHHLPDNGWVCFFRRETVE